MAAKITNQPKRALDLLSDEGSVFDARNLGGKMSLPEEFDVTQHAGAWHQEGNEVESRRGKDILVGTRFSAQGWEIWRYPAERPTSEIDKKTGQPVMEKHPKAGKPHTVTLAGKEAGTYVLMFRPAAVQAQVNEAYALLSRERLIGEVRGSTLTLPEAEASGGGMVTDDQLTRVIGAEADHEGRNGRSSVVHSALTGNSAQHLTGAPIRVSR